MDDLNPTTPPADAKPTDATAPETPDDGFSSSKSRFIAAWEVAGGDEKAIRSRYNPLPHWPKGYSGLTVGMGYDLKYQTQEGFKKDWGGHLTPEQLDKLDDYVPSITAKGKKVPPKKKANKAAVVATKDIDIQYKAAVKVYEDVTIPKFEAKVEKIFPGYGQMDPYSQAVILSVVYNRGDSMGKKKSLRRKHFMQIREAVVKKDVKAIAAAVRAMKVEHTNKANKKGLHNRRDGEANYLEQNYQAAQDWYAKQPVAQPAAVPPTTTP